MSRRYIQKTRSNELGDILPQVMAVVTAKDDILAVDDSQKYFKRNYIDAIRQIIPKFYFSDEQSISGTHISFPNQLINSHIIANKNQSITFPVSSLLEDTYLSSLGTPEGFSKHFYKGTPPSQIDADDFQRNILSPLGKNLTDFTTSQAFIDYVSGTFLPSIPMVYTGHHESDNLATLTTSAFANDSSGTYKYLANNLGWLYFLNREGPADVGGLPPSFDPSTSLATLLTTTIWQGKSVVLQDSLEIYQEYLWKNQPIFNNSEAAEIFIPQSYTSGVAQSTGIWTSGTQNIDRLKTLVSVVYSPHYLDSTDNKVQTAFTSYFDTSTQQADGTLITTTEEAGPLKRFLDAMSYSIADRVTEQAELNTLYDIGKCPEEFLELLGELIGWKFIGGDVDKWRVQLRNAVEIYKMKGTKRAIQYLLDTLFSTGMFNATTSDTLSELWESYVPDLIYYALATKSSAFENLDVYTANLAQQFGVTTYDPLDMDTNIKLLVDKILFDLVREFPDSFRMGGKPFPIPQLLLKGVPYVGPYNIRDTGEPGLFPEFWTESVYHGDHSIQLTLQYDNNFLFNYRNRVYLVPPYEKKQYYTPTQITGGMLDKIEKDLGCYGVDKTFATQVVEYIRSHTAGNFSFDSVLNSFLFYTKSKTYPPNYDEVLRDVTKEKTPDPVSLLSIWNGKSSHFRMNFGASDFDWGSDRLTPGSKYGLTQISRVLDQVIPAHAIPDIILGISSVADTLTGFGDLDCREWRPNFNDLYEGSSTVTTGFGVCAVNMGGLAIANSKAPHRFKRFQVDNVNDLLVSGNTFQAVGDANRNSLRRRNFHNLLPETKMFTRNGRNNPGSLQLSSAYYSSGIGYLPLGFIPSSLAFKSVDLVNNHVNNIGQLLPRTGLGADRLPTVWEICQNLVSPSSLYGYDISNTFPSRIKQTVAGSACATYGRRGQLQEIMYVMTKVNDLTNFLLASSIASGYMNDNGTINTAWPTGSDLLYPSNFSWWYNTIAKNTPDLAHLRSTAIRSMGNYLTNQQAADPSLNLYEHFRFGRPIHELYNSYMGLYKGHGTTNNYNLLGVPNIFSHTFGPLIFNSDLDFDGSALNASGYLAASAPIYEVDISYNAGSGVLSVSGMNGKGLYDLGTSAASDSGDLPIGRAEFRNKYLTSAIELVDTDTGILAVSPPHPTFGIFKLSRDDQTKYSFNKYLINNQILKYHRGVGQTSFPRVRIVIDNSDDTNKARNFLQPEHDYEITIKAHNLSVTGTELGGQKLGCWIHTLPELKANGSLYPTVRSYDPRGMYDKCNLYHDTWKTGDIATLSGVQGIDYVQNNCELQGFTDGNLSNPIGSGEAGSNQAGPIFIRSYDFRCWDPADSTRIIPGGNPEAIANVGPESLQELKFRFSTKEIGVDPQTPEYIAQYGKTHRLDQKYAIEIFIREGDAGKFVVIEDISIKDVTNYNKAGILTQYGSAPIDVQDFKAVMRYFKSLSSGLASRDAYNTSAVMEVSGGSRLNYRSNSSMYPTVETARQITEVDIHEG